MKCPAAIADGRVYVHSTAYGAAYDFSVPVTNVPALTLDPPKQVSPNQVELTIRAVDGSPIDSNRLATLEVRAATDLALSAAVWPRLTNQMVFDNGLVRVTDVDAAAPSQFFITSEPP